MKILLTGSSGFVGSAVYTALEKQGHEVTGFDLPDDDFTHIGRIGRVMRSKDLVVHCGAVANLYDTAKDPTETYEANIFGCYNIMTIAKHHKTPVVYISTCCVYGPHGDYADEKTLPNPVEFYARSKLAGEVILQELNDNLVILRLGTVYGPGMRPALFNYKILDKMRKGEKVELYGDGTASRNYIYIDDLVDGICKAVDKFPGGEIINLCGTEETDLLQVVGAAIDVSGIECDYVHAAPRDMGDYCEHINASKAWGSLRWHPNTKYYTGMKKLWEWMVEQESTNTDTV